MIDVTQCLLTCYEDCVINVNFFLFFSLHDRLEKEQRIPEVHIPSKPMSENFDDTISQLNVHKRVPITSKSPDDTDLSLNQTVDESAKVVIQKRGPMFIIQLWSENLVRISVVVPFGEL